MDYQIPLLFCFTFVCLPLLNLFLSRNSKSIKLPPGPKPWPIIGDLLQLSSNPHRSLARLSAIHGPLMSLRLGSVFTVVVSSPDIAREIFQKHDLAFSGRKVALAAQALDHHNHSVVFLPVSPKWRNLRKICTTHLFTKKRLDATELLRQRKLEELLDHVGECCRKGEAVEIGRDVFTTTMNLLSNTFFSIDLAGYGSASSSHRGFKDLVWEIMEAAGKPNLTDFFPFLGYLDLLGVKRRNESCLQKFFVIFDEIIEERLSGVCDKEDVLATLLKISNEDGSDLSLDDIRHLLLDMFVGGTDTTSTTSEWAMTELLLNPAKMAIAKAELEEILGSNGAIKESDIVRLPYLQAVVKETLRLHPPGPLLIPHKAEIDVENLCGYVIPKNSQMLINIWTMNQDPNTWKNPTHFFPERFLESKIDFGGQHFEFLPFGAGRRICPGMHLASRMLHMVLAKFLHCFNWKLEDGMKREDVDMSEKFGFVLIKAKPLLAIPVAK